MKNVIIGICVNLLLAAQFLFAEVIPISQLHNNDSNGLPLLMGQTVTVRGEITVANQFGISSFLQDETGGVAVYDQAFAGAVSVGDIVTVTGVVDNYRGLTELKDVSIDEHIPAAPKLQPLVVTCQMIANEGAGGIENLEGELIRINDVTVDTDFWTVTGSGTNYLLTDTTGSCEIRIDKDCNIANTNAPSGSFDVIGVLSQYDPSEPYTTGYQLMPRFQKDIVYLSGPKILTGPFETKIDPYALQIYWETDVPANSIVMYGLTEMFELDTLTVDESKTEHEIYLSNLSPATLYHIRAGSADASGTNFSGELLAMTASHPQSTGEINVYFNRSVDHSLALAGNEANGNVDLAQKFIDRVNAAQHSIDVCFYSWDLSNVTNALIDAKNRGVKVRFIGDVDHQYQTQVVRLRNSGIQVIDQSFSELGSWGIQHNKFAIFDARDNSSVTDDWVWTGSVNLTAYEELGVNAIQNALEIQDQALAKAYTLEFEEMWGSNTDTPNSSLSRFGSNKIDNIPHHFNVAGRHVELYMCPTDRATNQIISEIQQADREIYFCILAFTRYDVESAMYQQVQQHPTFYLSGVFDGSQDEGSQYYPMKGTGSYAWNPPADVWLDAEYGVLHHKYMVIDANHSQYDPVVITGSQNWSTSAETKNDENTLIIHDAKIANLYLQEFSARYHAAGGSHSLTEVKGDNAHSNADNFSLSQNYPNPFNRETIIEFYLKQQSHAKLSIYNLSGQLVRSFELDAMPKGTHRIIWDGRDQQGRQIAAGIYVYQLATEFGSSAKVRKMVYVP